MKNSIAASREVLWREVEGEIVILDPRRGRYYGIEGIGVRIWRLLQKRTTAGRVMKRLKTKYHVDDKQLRRDTADFIYKLRQSNLLERHS